MTKPRQCLLLLALAGCEAGGIPWLDVSGPAGRKRSPAEAGEKPYSAAEEGPKTAGAAGRGRGAEPAAARAEGRKVAPGESGVGTGRVGTGREVALTEGTPAVTAADGAVVSRKGGGGETPEAVAVAGTPAPSEARAAAAREARRPAGEETAAAAAAGVQPGIGEGGERIGEAEAPVAEPPGEKSSFWFYFLILLATALVGFVAWFFMQPPWKRGRWWRLFRAYVRDWRSGGLEETPRHGSPSLGVFSEGRAEPVLSRGGDAGAAEGAAAQEFGPATSLHIEDVTGDDKSAQPRREKKSPDYGDPLKPRRPDNVVDPTGPRDTGDGEDGAGATSQVAGENRAGKSGGGRKTGGRRTRRKRTTNITLPVIPRPPQERADGRKKS